MTTVIVRLNGESTRVPSQSLKDFLQQLKINARSLAVAINNKVIPSSEYPTTMINENDCVEVIQPICGG